MRVFNNYLDVRDELKDGVLTFGGFDGLHLGHMSLLNNALSDRFTDKNRGIFTFWPHKKIVLGEKCDFFYLTSYEQKLQILSKLNFNAIIFQELNSSFLQISPHDFIYEILHKQLKISDLIVGEDFCFGKNRVGDIKFLEREFKNLSMKLHVQAKVSIDDVRCSSSNIRELLSSGNLDKANKLLGRYFSLQGQVKHGSKKGRTIGFPTANIALPRGCQILFGVYATITRVFDKNNYNDFFSITNIGLRPSVENNSDPLIETHLLDTNLDIYSRNIEIFFLKRIRAEKKFTSIEKLKNQINLDIKQAKNMQIKILL